MYNGPVKMEILYSNYLVAYNNDTVVYRLTDVTQCAFPCKMCGNGNGVDSGVCMACYSNAITNNYLLYSNTSDSTNISGRCVGVCPTGTFTNTIYN
jgi:Fe-S-cluster-containing hydrogenase component 2